VCTDAEEKDSRKQASTVVTSENVRLLKNNITHTYSLFQLSQLQRNNVPKFHTSMHFTLSLIDINGQITLLKLQCLITYLAEE
jgi:hypothetical protein